MITRSRVAAVIVATAALALAAASGAGAFGRFGSPHSVPAESAYQVAIGDLNGDGIADIAASNDGSQTGAVVAHGTGNGTFGPPELVPAASTGTEGVAIGKFNSDKRRDLAISDYVQSTISLFYGQKGGSFKTGPVLDSGPGAFLLATADLNEDGRTDIVSTNYSSAGSDEVSVLLQKKAGGFKPHVDYAGSGAGYGIAVGRVNGDKHTDVVVQASDGSFAVLLGRGNGTLRAPLTKTLADGNGYDNVALGDYNGDGKTDVAAADYDDDEVNVFLGAGNGTFPTSKVTDLTGLGPEGVAAGDFNRDGKLDLAVGGYSLDQVQVLFGKGNGKFRATPSVAPTTDSTYNLVAGKLNADKGLDLVAGTASSADVLLNKR